VINNFLSFADVGERVDGVSFLMGVEGGGPGEGESDCRVVE
jgi:hypothetical protein